MLGMKAFLSHVYSYHGGWVGEGRRGCNLLPVVYRANSWASGSPLCVWRETTHSTDKAIGYRSLNGWMEGHTHAHTGQFHNREHTKAQLVGCMGPHNREHMGSMWTIANLHVL